MCKHTFVMISVMKHVTLKLSVDWSTDEPLYTSQQDMMVANKLDTKGLHLESDDTPENDNQHDFKLVHGLHPGHSVLSSNR